MQRHRRVSNTTNWVHLMANNSSRTFASDGKINTALLNFGNAKRLCLFCLMGLYLFCLTRLFCFMRQNKMHGFVWVDQDWIGLMILKNLRIRTGSDSTFAYHEWTRTEQFQSPLISDVHMAWSQKFRLTPESKICEKLDPKPESLFNFWSSRSLLGQFLSKNMGEFPVGSMVARVWTGFGFSNLKNPGPGFKNFGAESESEKVTPDTSTLFHTSQSRHKLMAGH